MSKNTLKLQHPIMINGKKVKELTYDAEEIDSNMFIKVSGMANDLSRENGSQNITVMECDNNLHLLLGMAAVVAINDDIDIEDLKRAKGIDVLKLAQVGRNFIISSSEEGSPQSSSEEQSEPIPESTTQE